MSFSVENFIGTVKANDLARQNRFIVEIGGSSFVSLMATATTFPLLSINVKSHKIFGPAYQRPITSEYGGDGVTVTFLVDRDMNVKKFFDSWTQSVVAPTGGVSYQAEYVRPVSIKQLNQQDQVVYTVELIEAFPRNVNLMSLNQAAQSQVHTVDVLFAYRYWRTQSEAPGLTSVSSIIPPVPLLPTPRRFTWDGSSPGGIGTFTETLSGSDLPISA